MSDLGTFEKYLIEEFYDDYREGQISRRTFIRRVAFITGSMGATLTALTAVGCSPAELPTATEPMPVPVSPTAGATVAADGTATATAAPTTEPQSPLSVKEGDPAVTGSRVTIPVESTDISGYLAQPAAAGVYPAILICHENRGLTPHIEDVARRFAKAGYVALALDLLSREGGTAANDRDAIPGILTNAGAERHVGDFKAAAVYLKGLDTVDPERLGMNGYCFGGGITWQAATQMPELKAAVPFYGPGPDAAAVASISAAMLGVYAEQDERVNAGKDALDQALTAAGVTHQMNVYPGVNHAFHNDTGQRYVEAQATQAWNDMLAWFGEYL
ncbi:MAG TPA: dienelactone hydrolase family protein [Anaerolineae bacterium]|nr:dienelactone hydrolase family protein [Anaerolineae bacterium]